MGKLSLSTTKEELFGSLDALDENDNVFRHYFVEIPIFHKLKGDTKFLFLVGEKGTGKSALMKMCMIVDKDQGRIVVNIQRPQVQENVAINEKINQWKDFLANEILKSIQKHAGNNDSRLGKFLSIAESSASDYIKETYNIDYLKLKSQILDLISDKLEIRIYVDDLDMGYRGTMDQNESIISLFTASREIIRENPNVKIRITLRTDVYYNVRNFDESADKIQNAKIPLSITNHEIMYMLTKRVTNFLGNPIQAKTAHEITQKQMLESMNALFEPVFYGRGKWEKKPMQYILMTMTRRRPRDLFVLCGLAWDTAVKHGRTKITSTDLQDNFNEYSNERLRDTIGEYHHEFKSKDDLQELILALEPSENAIHSKYIFTKDELIAKITTMTERYHFRMHKKNYQQKQIWQNFYIRLMLS